MSIKEMALYFGIGIGVILLMSTVAALQGRFFVNNRKYRPPELPVPAAIAMAITAMAPCGTTLLIAFGLASVSLAGGSARDAKYFIDSLPWVYGMEVVLMTIVGVGLSLNAGLYGGENS